MLCRGALTLLQALSHICRGWEGAVNEKGPGTRLLRRPGRLTLPPRISPPPPTPAALTVCQLAPKLHLLLRHAAVAEARENVGLVPPYQYKKNIRQIKTTKTFIR